MKRVVMLSVGFLAVLVSSAPAQMPPGPGGRMRLPGSIGDSNLSVVGIKEVQEELGAADAQKKKLVWEFIALAATRAWQEKYVQLTGSPAGRLNMINAEQAKTDPHLAAITQAAEKAENLFPTQPALRENYNEFATLFSRAVVRMQSSTQPTDAILANLQKELTAAIPLP
jgi:ABC-type glycerol-3-phosphate transport system substrate-binding protein